MREKAPDDTRFKVTREHLEAFKTQYQFRADAIIPRNSPDAPTIEQLSAIRLCHLNISRIIKEVINLRYKAQKQTDYHDFSWRGSDKEFRNKMNIGDIYVNAARCKICGWFIRSRNRHDMCSCSCGKVSIDGGSHYIKVSGNPEHYELITEYFDDVKDLHKM